MNSVQQSQRVAIIGSGISGLTAAYLLNNYGACLDNGERRFEISVFESANRIGGHTATIAVEHEGAHYNIDTGFIVYNDWTYPNFIRLINELGVETQATDMSFSVSCNDTGLEYSGSSLNTLFAQRRNMLRGDFWRMLRDIARFNHQAVVDLEEGNLSEGATLGDYLRTKGYSGLFVSHYLVPMCAAIWSASTAEVMNFPLIFFVRFFKNHGLLSINNRPQWRVINGGSSAYLKPLVQSFEEKIELNAVIKSVRRSANKVELEFADGSIRAFDSVIFACHSDQALALLAEPTTAERSVLGAIPYNSNEVMLHTDTRLLPRERRAWAAWNYLLDRNNDQQAVLTYNMNILQGIKSNTEFCVTLNARDKIDAAKVLGVYHYSHPAYSLASITAQNRWAEINGRNNTYFCGAYWANGFHEDGVLSAIRVAEALRVKW